MNTIRSIKALLLIALFCVNTIVFAQIIKDNPIVLPDNMDSVNCIFFPDGVNWGVRIGWSSESIASNFNIPLVGDLDDDGNPEIVCCSQNGDMLVEPYRYNNELLVFDGVTKQLKTTISLQSKITASDVAAYGLVKLPNRKGLIVVASFDYKLRAYDITSSNPSIPYWVSDVDFGSNFGDWAVNVSFADFNSDGHPEVYVRNKIYNAETGVLLAQANSTNTGSSYAHWSHLVHYKVSSPFAANVCGDDNLELILGNKVYSVNIVNPNGQSSNSITLAQSITPPSGIIEDGHPQVADFNMDGYLDVFISIRDTNVHSGTVYGYVWDIHNNSVSSPFIINTSFSGKSIPMIDDIDNDGMLEVLIQCGVSGSNQKFHAYKYHPNTQTFSFLWGYVTDEDSFSNGVTSFDFNQDGLLELIICDQSTLSIVNGSGISHITHNDTIPVYVISSFPFSEITIMQYPVVVDADNDGHAEIVSVGSDKLNILKSNGAEWVPARKVWNQYMYNVTPVNNDLTVTQYQFNNGTAFIDPNGVVRRPFNNFLQQVTTLDQYGRPFIAAADVAALSANITSISGDAALNVIYANQGDYTLFAPYYITVFANQVGGTVIQTFTIETPLPIGGTAQQVLSLPITDLCQVPNLSSLVVAINCNGGGIAQEGDLQPECDITNNTLEIPVNSSEPTYITETACDQYVWNGNTYMQTGQYEQTLVNSYGCDSLVILNLTINHSDTIDYNISACESYTWNGQNYSQSGNYTYNTTNEFGCDRLEILHLTITSSFRQEDEIMECDSYYWPHNQQWYYQSVLDSIVIQGAPGECDSTFVLDLTIHYSDTLTLEAVTTCDSYEWHGVSYTESGTYVFDTLNQGGCVLEYILPLTINHSDTLDWEPVTACDSYLWNGQTITETGDYSMNTINGEGCDRLERIHVTIGYNTYDTLAPVTACDDYVWHETTYTQTGVYSYETQDPTGCLHTEVLFLTVNHSSENEFSVTSCESYEWFGVVYDEPGTYTHTLTNSHGCDSLLIMHLDIGETFVLEETAVGCNEYEWHGTLYNQGGDYQYEAANPNGCDSLFILHLTIAPTYEREIEAEACYSYVWANEVYTQSGDYEHHFSSVTGCDSLVILHLTITESVQHEFEQQSCLPPFVWNGISYYEDGYYEQTLTAGNGCDSIVTMHLTFGEQFNTDITVNTCEDVYTWNGTDYLESGTYQQTFQSLEGCDSIVNLHLTFAEAFTVNIDTLSCGAFFWEGNSLPSGTYQYQYQTAQGCDSIVNLHLTIGASLTNSIQGRVYIYPFTDINSGFYSYYIDSTGVSSENVHWDIDRDDWLLFPHGASCDLLCTSAGRGVLHAWTVGELCNVDTTLILNATFFGVGEDEAQSIFVHPNPTNGNVMIRSHGIITIAVYNILGRKLTETKVDGLDSVLLDIGEYHNNVYILEVKTLSKNAFIKVVLNK